MSRKQPTPATAVTVCPECKGRDGKHNKVLVVKTWTDPTWPGSKGGSSTWEKCPNA